jgi:hypothetical protein
MTYGVDNKPIRAFLAIEVRERPEIQLNNSQVFVGRLQFPLAHYFNVSRGQITLNDANRPETLRKGSRYLFRVLRHNQSTFR